MANLTTVTLSNGLGTGGSGTISTLDNLVGTAGSASTNVLTVQGIASGTAFPVTVSGSNNNGRAVPGSSAPVVLASQIYQDIAASQSTVALTGGSGGATGDWLDGILVIPETTSAGTVALKDGTATAVNIFVTGTLPSLVPFYIPIGALSHTGAWQITTGASVHVRAIGNFT